LPKSVDTINIVKAGLSSAIRKIGKCGWLLPFLAATLYCAAASAAATRIEGVAQYEFVNYRDGSSRLIASSRLVIVVDGPQYRISTDPVQGVSPLRLSSEGATEEYGCDGTDTFFVTDRKTMASRGTGKSAMIVGGRFPIHGSGLVQAAWLGYCSDGYFESAANRTNLALAYVLTWVRPEMVTNQVQEYWPNSHLAKAITGWSRNVVKYANQEPIELTYYPNGWKEWKFTASDDVLVGGNHFPRSLLLEGFAPRPKDRATTGDDTALLRRLTFVASSIILETNDFAALPSIPYEHLPLFDRRFEKMTAPYYQIDEVSPASGWPTRSSPAFKLVEAEAADLAHRSDADKRNPQRATATVWIICGGNLAVFGFLVRAIRKAKLNKNRKIEAHI
jgi:hypothetical protein